MYTEWIKDIHGIYSCANCGLVAPYELIDNEVCYWPELNYCPCCGRRVKNSEILYKKEKDYD